MKKSFYLLTNKKGSFYRVWSPKTNAEVEFNQEYYEAFFSENFSFFSEEELASLQELGFLVTDNQNEICEVNEKIQKFESSNRLLIVFPTMQCNFRCRYCPEEKNPSKLSPQIYEKLLAAIELDNISTFSISWFGGEPTLELEHIVNFQQKLLEKARKKGVRIDGRITTNFYALTLPNFKKLVESGITYFQITLDGFEDTHDFYRPLTGGGKTYQRILDNLIACQESDLDFKVVIRTNFDAKTDYKPFINSLRRFKGDNRFVFSINEIFAGSPIDPELICSREGALIKRKELVKAYHKAGLPLNETDEKIGFFLPCYACQKNTAIVDAEGRVRKCTLHLEDPKNDLGNFENFSSLNDGFWVGPRFSDCELCRFYPICLGRMCRYRTLANRKECEDQRLKEYAILNDE